MPVALALVFSFFSLSSNSFAQVSPRGEIFLTYVETGTYRNLVTGARERWPEIQTYADVDLPRTSTRPLRTKTPVTNGDSDETTKNGVKSISLSPHGTTVYFKMAMQTVDGDFELYSNKSISLAFEEEEHGRRLYAALMAPGARYEILSTSYWGWNEPNVKNAYIYNHDTEEMMKLMDFVKQNIQVELDSERIRKDLESDIEYLESWLSRLKGKLSEFR